MYSKGSGTHVGRQAAVGRRNLGRLANLAQLLALDLTLYLDSLLTRFTVMVYPHFLIYKAVCERQYGICAFIYWDLTTPLIHHDYDTLSGSVRLYQSCQ